MSFIYVPFSNKLEDNKVQAYAFGPQRFEVFLLFFYRKNVKIVGAFFFYFELFKSNSLIIYCCFQNVCFIFIDYNL